MLFSNWFAIVSNAITTFVCGSIMVLLLTQLKRDRTAWAVIRLMFNMVLLSFSVVMLRLMAHEGYALHPMFVVATVLTGCLPVNVLLFIDIYFGIRNHWRRHVALFIIVMVALVTVGLIVEIATQSAVVTVPNSIYIAGDGQIMYAYGPAIGFGALIILIEEAVMLFTLISLVRLLRSKSDPIDRRVVYGLIVIIAGMIIVPLPGLEHYAFEQILYATGSVILIGPVLRRRMYDPLSQMNAALIAQAKELRASAEQNEQLVGEVKQANAATVQIIGFVSHEMRNGVGEVINLSTGMLEEPFEYNGQVLPEVFQMDMRRIVTAGKYLKQLLNDIVDWGQIRSGNLHLSIKPVDPVPLLQEVLHFAATAVKPAVQVCADFPQTLLPINADELRLKQILRNLVNNAGKFTTAGSVTIGAQQDGQFVRFKVSDTGPGIKPEEQGRLFQAYSQASNTVRQEHGGNGLGLHICQQLVQLHQGTIWLTSTPGQGTTFYFTLPVAGELHAQMSDSAQ